LGTFPRTGADSRRFTSTSTTTDDDNSASITTTAGSAHGQRLAPSPHHRQGADRRPIANGITSLPRATVAGSAPQIPRYRGFLASATRLASVSDRRPHHHDGRRQASGSRHRFADLDAIEAGRISAQHIVGPPCSLNEALIELGRFLRAAVSDRNDRPALRFEGRGW
jgi:hypothetical protein